MNRLLKRQLKRHFGDDFDLLNVPKKVLELIEDISKSYDELYEEKKFLEHTIDINSQDLEKANKKIREQNRDLQKLLEKTSDENEEMIYMLKQYKEAIDASLIVSTTDTNGIIKYVNENFIQISGYSKDELIGKSHNIVRHPENPESLFREMWSEISSGKVWQGVFSNLSKDGSTYYVNAVVAPLLNRDGKIIEYMALRRDMTASVKYQNKLEQQKQRISQILDNQESIIVLFDNENGVVEVNKKFQEVFGFDSLKAFREKHKCICELFEAREGFLKPTNGDELWFSVVLEESQKVHLSMIHEKIYSVKIAIIDMDGKKTYLATFTDITEIENARVKSHEAESQKSEFLANMSHEIRTPMNAILGFSELLAKTQLTPKQSRFVELVKSSSKTLIQIINDILDFSKLQSGQSEIEAMKTNPFMEFEDTFMLLGVRAKEKDISYMIEIDASLGECMECDSFHIKQILTNLIGNAIKFTPQNGTVHVKIEKTSQDSKEMVRFLVQDSGIGIPKDRQEKIFEPFSQADSSTTRKFGGTGLGLSISNTLVKLMGSHLKLDSKEGSGSKFYFDIEYKNCQTSDTLKERLNGFEIYLFEEEIGVSKQLDAYKIPHKIIQKYEDSVDVKNSLIICKNQKASKDFKNATVLLLSHASDNYDDERHRHVENFDEFQSILYNELMRLRIIHSNIKSSGSKDINLKILVAEDYEVNRILIAELLEQFNIGYKFALNGEEAVEMVRHEKYDLIFMDINMPVMNGIDATKIIINELSIKTPIVALTANALEGDKERFLSAGMDDYLTKPIDIEAFETLLLKYSKRISSKPYLDENTQFDEQIESDFDVETALKNTIKKMNLSSNIVERLFKSYLVSLDKIEKNLEDGALAGDFAKLHINAHNLKSGAASLCFGELSKIAQEIETNAKNQNSDFDFLAKAQTLKPFFKLIRDFDRYSGTCLN